MIRTIPVERLVSDEAKKPCDDPVVLPDRRLGEAESAALWGRDRTALRVCETRRAAGVASHGGAL